MANEITAALAKAVRNFKPVTKNRVAKVGSYSYKYADLSDVMESCRDALGKEGLVIVQSVEDGSLITRLLHESGGEVSNKVPIFFGGTPQAVGSALTYARRYGITCLLGVVAEDDDDGHAAKVMNAPRQTRRPSMSFATGAQIKALWSLWKRGSKSEDEIRGLLKDVYGKNSTKELTEDEASCLIENARAELEELIPSHEDKGK